jgi:hypothetical protein
MPSATCCRSMPRSAAWSSSSGADRCGLCSSLTHGVLQACAAPRGRKHRALAADRQPNAGRGAELCCVPARTLTRGQLRAMPQKFFDLSNEVKQRTWTAEQTCSRYGSLLRRALHYRRCADVNTAWPRTLSHGLRHTPPSWPPRCKRTRASGIAAAKNASTLALVRASVGRQRAELKAHADAMEAARATLRAELALQAQQLETAQVGCCATRCASALFASEGVCC